MVGESPGDEDFQQDGLTPQYEDDLLDQLDSSLSENFSQEDRQVVARFIAQRTSGPLPSASEMREYKNVDPELPRLIFDMAKDEQQHRHTMEAREQEKTYDAVYKNQEDRRNAVSQGQIFGFVIAVVVLGLAAFMAWLGHEAFALVLAGIDVVGLAAVFVTSSRAARDDNPDTDSGVEYPDELGT